MTDHLEPTPAPEPERWPRLGALVTIPGLDGIWSVWSKGEQPQSNEGRGGWWIHPRPPLTGWWLVPVDATERERARLAVLRRDTEFTKYEPENETAPLI